MAFGVLAIPASLACCLAEGDSSDRGTGSGWRLGGSGPGILLEESGRRTLSTDVTTMASEDDMEALEGKLRRRMATVVFNHILRISTLTLRKHAELPPDERFDVSSI